MNDRSLRARGLFHVRDVLDSLVASAIETRALGAPRWLVCRDVVEFLVDQGMPKAAARLCAEAVCRLSDPEDTT